MLGNVGRHRRWPWAVLFFLFALTFVWSLAVVGEKGGGVWNILLIVSAVGVGISLVLLVLMFISARRLRRAEGDESPQIGAEGQQPAEQPATEETAPTYEEVFGLELESDEASLLRAPEDEGWPGDEGSEMGADGQQAEEQAPTSEEDVQAVDADVDEAVDQVDALDADGESQDHLRQMREEFKARAEEAALRVKQREAELHEAASAPDSQR